MAQNLRVYWRGAVRSQKRSLHAPSPHGLIVPRDFPITPPSGPYVSSEIHPINTGGQHPLGAVHKDQARPFDRGAGGAWQHWSRPFPDWATSKRTVAAYMSHIWKLWDSQ